MNRCTVCGATSREGAKFCTSCGARLGEEPQSERDGATSAQPETTTATATRDAEQPEATSVSDEPREAAPTLAEAETPTGEDDTSDSCIRDDLAPSGAERNAPGDSGKPYASNWPSATTASPTEDVPVEDVQTSNQATDSGTGNYWPSTSSRMPRSDEGADEASERVVTAPAPDSFATDADQDPDREELRSDDDQHGPSAWEGWSPTATGPSVASDTTSDAGDDRFESISRLADDLKRQVDRLAHPASLASRDLNPDDLADQLERWSRAVPDSDELLEAVKEVRRSPRDIDALVRLADRAPDLELLVRHYQSITSASDGWVEQLRRNQEGSTNE